MRHLSFQSKMVTAGVMGKALLMGILVSLLAFSSFEKSVILVLVSATATGIFGIIIVIVQSHFAREIHDRIDAMEDRTKQTVVETTGAAVASVSAQIMESAAETQNPQRRKDDPKQ